MKWGVGFGDFDNDGWPDILIANGNFSSLMDHLETEVKYREPLQLFRNIGGQRFEDIANTAGLNDGPSAIAPRYWRLAISTTMAIWISSFLMPPGRRHCSSTRLITRTIGRCSASLGRRATAWASARVSRFSAEPTEQVDEVRGGGGYNSSNDTRLHFGLGQSAMMNKIEVSLAERH